MLFNFKVTNSSEPIDENIVRSYFDIECSVSNAPDGYRFIFERLMCPRNVHIIQGCKDSVNSIESRHLWFFQIFKRLCLFLGNRSKEFRLSDQFLPYWTALGGCRLADLQWYLRHYLNTFWPFHPDVVIVYFLNLYYVALLYIIVQFQFSAFYSLFLKNL